MPSADPRVPVTVLTGFLGSGKTTLLNRILTEEHGRRIAVIENEFGEVGIDNDLVIDAEEEIFEMNNGCICCTVRGDLIRILGRLMRRRDRFDRILIETTGLADPGPVAQTFFVDDEMAAHLRLDGIVTVVDARHVWQHIDTAPEVKEQLAFADVVLINKADLADEGELAHLERRVRGINSRATVHRSAMAAGVPLDALLEVGGFSLDRALEVDPEFLRPQYPFEWAGVFATDGPVSVSLSEGPDPEIDLLVLPADGAGPDALDDLLRPATLAFSDEPVPLGTRDALPPGRLARLAVGAGGAWVSVEPATTGPWALFTQHGPSEFTMEVGGPSGRVAPETEREFAPDHEHDDEVTSVGIELPGEVDGDRLNTWLGGLLAARGPDIFRSKGILAVKGDPRRFVFQGVHMLMDSRPDREWGDEPRRNSLVFIGRGLDRAELTEGFRACLA